jgi:transcriptional regulator CtsR
MKKSLADRIEEYLKVLIARNEDKQIEIQRAELAETFNCVPSQVTYVIATRFTQKHGYFSESRRGGSGFVRISRFEEGYYLNAIREEKELSDLLDKLLENRLINAREKELLDFILNHILKNIPAEEKGKIFDSLKKALLEFENR